MVVFCGAGQLKPNISCFTWEQEVLQKKFCFQEQLEGWFIQPENYDQWCVSRCVRCFHICFCSKDESQVWLQWPFLFLD